MRGQGDQFAVLARRARRNHIRDVSARAAWLAIESQFLGNRETRALFLDAEFRNFRQGDLSITDYCRKFKGMADALGDLGEPVPDRTLVLNVIRGLNERFSSIGLHLRRGRPLPTFLEVRNDLLLEELTLAHHSSTSATALLASGPPKASPNNSKPKQQPHQQSRGKRAGKKGGRSQPNDAAPGGFFSGPSVGGQWPSPVRGQWPSPHNPWSGSIHMWPGPRAPGAPSTPRHDAQQQPPPLPQSLLAGAQGQWSGIQQPLPPWPGSQQPPPLTTQQQWQAPPPGFYSSGAPLPSWDQQALLSDFSTMTLQPPQQREWYFDSGATTHMSSDAGTLSQSTPTQLPCSIIVGNGHSIPVISAGHAALSNSLRLNNVLVAPNLIKNLISVRQFTSDNNCSVEFDPFGCSVKDLLSRKEIVRCDSSGPLYPLRLSASTFHAAVSPSLWHQRLGHPGREVMSKLAHISGISCNKNATTDTLCHACQLGRHTCLPFSVSSSRATKIFQLIHCDLWTSPVLSISGFKYYLVILDDYSHYLWTFPLRLKSDTFATLTHFFSYVHTQFGVPIQGVQCDNGREFDNSSTRAFFLTNGVHLRMSCPYTSPQNGKAERIIRTINDVVRSLLFQASIPPSYWAEALNTTTRLLNILPTKTLRFSTPHQALFGTAPVYNHLRVFGCKCYPNLLATSPHKLAPRSVLCVFLGYSDHHKGYRCLDIHSNKIIISRHVVFDETSFPFAEQSSTPTAEDFEFLLDSHPAVPAPIGSARFCLLPAGLTDAPAQPRAAPVAAVSSPCSNDQLLPLPTAAPTPDPGSARTNAAAPAVVADRAPDTQPGPGPRRFDGFVYTRRSAPAPTADATPSPQAPAATTPVAAPAAPTPVVASSPSAAASQLPPGAVPVPPVVNHHRMTTRAKLGFRQPALFHAAQLSPVPRTYRAALADPHWRQAMEEEFSALLGNNTWDLVPRPPAANIVSGKWVFKHKFHADGSLERYKARWVLRGFSQRPGIDFDETFSPVVKPATVRTVLTLALSRNRPVHQLDVKNAFLHGTLSETVYCSQPSGFTDSAHPDFVCRLNRSLYGLKQAPRAWYSRFASFLLSLGFVEAKSDTSLFVYCRGTDLVYLLLYVDDIVLTASSTALLRRIIGTLQQEFSMKDLGELHHFLGMQVQRTPSGLFLSQRQYMVDILTRAGMAECKPCSTPVDVNPKLSGTDGTPVTDPTDFRSLAGALQYLTFTRPDIAYAVQQVCLHMHDPREPHLAALKRILRYVRGTLHLGLLLRPSAQTELVVYSDADWAGCPDTRRSTSGYAVFLGDSLISWSSKRQNTVSRSSAEAEYRAVANAVAEATWLRQLLLELHAPLQRAALVYCDNISTVFMSSNPVQHQRTKHIEIDLHFVRERVALGTIRVLHVPTTSQYADIFTKGLPSSLFTEFRSSLNVQAFDAPTAGGC